MKLFKKVLLSLSLISAPVIANSGYVEDNYKANFNTDIFNILPNGSYDNNLLESCHIPSSQLYTQAKGVLRATKGGQVVAYIIVADPQGHNGPITFYSVIDPKGRVLGIRVLEQTETIGKGSQITSTNWLEAFSNKNISDALKPNFALKIDGGNIDKFSGSTITPRAIISELKADFIEIGSTLIKTPAIFDSWNKCSIK